MNDDALFDADAYTKLWIGARTFTPGEVVHGFGKCIAAGAPRAALSA